MEFHGFYKDNRFRWNFKSHKGIIVPVIQNNKVTSLRIHLDNLYNTDTTDIWFSSSQLNCGSKVKNNIMFLFPDDNILKFMNNNEKKDIIIVSEMILAYKINQYLKENIVIRNS